MIAPSMIKLLHTITRFDTDGLYNLLVYTLTFDFVASDTLPYPYDPLCVVSYIHSLVLLISTN